MKLTLGTTNSDIYERRLRILKSLRDVDHRQVGILWEVYRIEYTVNCHEYGTIASDLQGLRRAGVVEKYENPDAGWNNRFWWRITETGKQFLRDREEVNA